MKEILQFDSLEDAHKYRDGKNQYNVLFSTFIKLIEARKSDFFSLLYAVPKSQRKSFKKLLVDNNLVTIDDENLTSSYIQFTCLEEEEDGNGYIVTINHDLCYANPTYNNSELHIYKEKLVGERFSMVERFIDIKRARGL